MTNAKTEIGLISIRMFFQREWERLTALIQQRNDAAVAAWGASLQYKRRYTNPDDAKRFRKA